MYLRCPIRFHFRLRLPEITAPLFVSPWDVLVTPNFAADSEILSGRNDLQELQRRCCHNSRSFRQPAIFLNRPSSQIHRTPEPCLKKSYRSRTRISARDSQQRTKTERNSKSVLNLSLQIFNTVAYVSSAMFLPSGRPDDCPTTVNQCPFISLPRFGHFEVLPVGHGVKKRVVPSATPRAGAGDAAVHCHDLYARERKRFLICQFHKPTVPNHKHWSGLPFCIVTGCLS